jgi:hypothetical protein
MMMVGADGNASLWCVRAIVVVAEEKEKWRGVCENYIAGAMGSETAKQQQVIIFLSDAADFGFDVARTGMMDQDVKILWMDQENRSTERSVIRTKKAGPKAAMIGIEKLRVTLTEIPAVIEMDCLSAIPMERSPAANMSIALEEGAETRYPSEIQISSRFEHRLWAIGEIHWA